MLNSKRFLNKINFEKEEKNFTILDYIMKEKIELKILIWKARN